MWAELIPLFGTFTSAVLSAADAEGYPASVRTSITPDTTRQVVGVNVPAALELAPGPAALLMHSHNEQLWDLRIVMVRGVLELNGSEWCFRPLAIASGVEQGGLAAARMVLACRKSARIYLQKRGLTRPIIPWNKLNAIKYS